MTPTPPSVPGPPKGTRTCGAPISSDRGCGRRLRRQREHTSNGRRAPVGAESCPSVTSQRAAPHSPRKAHPQGLPGQRTSGVDPSVAICTDTAPPPSLASGREAGATASTLQPRWAGGRPRRAGRRPPVSLTLPALYLGVGRGWGPAATRLPWGPSPSLHPIFLRSPTMLAES